MNIQMSYGRLVDYNIPEHRLRHIVDSNEYDATHLNIFERIIDFFRTNKKADAYKELYKLATSGCENKIEVFEKLKSFAKPGYEHLFRAEVLDNDIVLFIGDCSFKASVDLHSKLRVSEAVDILPMTIHESEVFYKMLSFIHERDKKYCRRNFQGVRAELIEHFSRDVMKLYRNGDKADVVNFLGDELTQLERQWLFYARDKPLDYALIFSVIGNQEVECGVAMNMLHPSFIYLFSYYDLNASMVDGNASSMRDIRTRVLTALNVFYGNYMNNRPKFNPMLLKL